MSTKYFWVLFALILLLSFVLRIIPPQNNNFYFTVDQANDAVHAREIFDNGKLVLKGPETSMPGIFAGPLWYYFISIGYVLFNGNPFGALFMVILLGVATTGYVMWELKSRVNPKIALLVGILLQGYWYFYDFSRYAFNPFVLGILSFWYVFSVIRFLDGKGKHYFLSLIPIFLMFNAAVAAAVVFLLFHFFIGLWGVYKKLLPLKTYVFVTIILPALFTSPILLQLSKQLKNSSFVNDQIAGERGFFSGFNFFEITLRFSEIFQRSIVPQSLLVSIILFSAVIYLFTKKKTHNKFALVFSTLSLMLFVFSFIFFGTNKIWREWHTIYLYPLLFTSLILMISSLKKYAAIPLLAILVVSQLSLFTTRYMEYLKPSDDPGILANQLKVFDWIYTNNNQDGFNSYTFTPHLYDYNSQYLFGWYGKSKHGFVPCEYSLFPGFLKHTYIPSPDDYSQPTLGCDNLRFLIIEPGGDETAYAKWRDATVFERGERVETVKEGQFTIEKWRIIPRVN